MYGCAWFGDKWHLRGPFVIFNAAYGILGLGMLGWRWLARRLAREKLNPLS